MAAAVVRPSFHSQPAYQNVASSSPLIPVLQLSSIIHPPACKRKRVHFLLSISPHFSGALPRFRSFMPLFNRPPSACLAQISFKNPWWRRERERERKKGRRKRHQKKRDSFFPLDRFLSWTVYELLSPSCCLNTCPSIYVLSIQIFVRFHRHSHIFRLPFLLL